MRSVIAAVGSAASRMATSDDIGTTPSRVRMSRSPMYFVMQRRPNGRPQANRPTRVKSVEFGSYP
jgi:hypothetical protein